MIRVAFPPAVLLGLLAAATSFALTCSGRTISRGDRKIEVLAKCGEPAWREERVEERTERVLHEKRNREQAEEFRVISSVEEWAYNFGPNRLLHFLTFKDGKLYDIQTGEYGYLKTASPNPGLQCWGESMATDRRKFEVLKYCGQPVSVDTRYVERASAFRDWRRKRVTELRQTVTVDEWTYNFGPDRLIYVFTFENGRVVDVHTEGYGF